MTLARQIEGGWSGVDAAASAASRWSGLMAAAQAGDRASYRRLLLEIDPWLGRYYARRLPRGIAEDAKQDALLAVHTRRHTYDPSRPFEPWLAAIARYKWIDRLRAMARDPVAHAVDTADLSEAQLVDAASGAMSALVLLDLLERLKPAQAIAIRMVKISGYSVAETSARTGQSPSLVKINIHRGLRRIAGLLAMENVA